MEPEAWSRRREPAGLRRHETLRTRAYAVAPLRATARDDPMLLLAMNEIALGDGAQGATARLEASIDKWWF